MTVFSCVTFGKCFEFLSFGNCYNSPHKLLDFGSFLSGESWVFGSFCGASVCFQISCFVVMFINLWRVEISEPSPLLSTLGIEWYSPHPPLGSHKRITSTNLGQRPMFLTQRPLTQFNSIECTKCSEY